MKTFLATVLFLSPVSVLADEYQHGYSSSKTCFRSEYREEYVPGNESNPGYVKSWKETIEFPCTTNPTVTKRTIIERERYVDDNDCTDGKIAGALIGGGAAAAMSRGDGRWWSIPIGAVIGGTVGCELNGG